MNIKEIEKKLDEHLNMICKLNDRHDELVKQFERSLLITERLIKLIEGKDNAAD